MKEKPISVFNAMVCTLVGVVLFYAALWAFLKRILMVSILVTLGIAIGCHSVDPVKQKALDDEIAAITSIAETPGIRTPDDRTRIAADGLLIHKHWHELAGVTDGN